MSNLGVSYSVRRVLSAGKLREDLLRERKGFMYAYLIVLAGAGTAALYGAVRNTKQVHVAIAYATRKAHIHEMLATLLIVSHASEIGHVVEQLSFIHIIVALLIFAAWMLSRFGTEGELA